MLSDLKRTDYLDCAWMFVGRGFGDLDLKSAPIKMNILTDSTSFFMIFKVEYYDN